MGEHVVLIVNDDESWADLIPEEIKIESEGKWKAVVCTTEKRLRKILDSEIKIEAALVDIRLDGFREDSWSIAQGLKRLGIQVSMATIYLLDWQAQRAKESGIPAFEINYMSDNKFSYWDVLEKTVSQESGMRGEREK